MVRWLGRSAAVASTQIDLGAVKVRTAQKEKDPFLQDIPIFSFAKPAVPVEGVMEKVLNQPSLEAVLLTPDGRKDTPLEGIVAQWDAARFATDSRPSRPVRPFTS